MRNNSELCLSEIDNILREHIRGKYDMEESIHKIKILVDAYTELTSAIRRHTECKNTLKKLEGLEEKYTRAYDALLSS